MDSTILQSWVDRAISAVDGQKSYIRCNSGKRSAPVRISKSEARVWTFDDLLDIVSDLASDNPGCWLDIVIVGQTNRLAPPGVLEIDGAADATTVGITRDGDAFVARVAASLAELVRDSNTSLRMTVERQQSLIEDMFAKLAYAAYEKGTRDGEDATADTVALLAIEREAAERRAEAWTVAAQAGRQAIELAGPIMAGMIGAAANSDESDELEGADQPDRDRASS